jgi:hypothetical protein
MTPGGLRLIHPGNLTLRWGLPLSAPGSLASLILFLPLLCLLLALVLRNYMNAMIFRVPRLINESNSVPVVVHFLRCRRVPKLLNLTRATSTVTRIASNYECFRRRIPVTVKRIISTPPAAPPITPIHAAPTPPALIPITNPHLHQQINIVLIPIATPVQLDFFPRSHVEKIPVINQPKRRIPLRAFLLEK